VPQRTSPSLAPSIKAGGAGSDAADFRRPQLQYTRQCAQEKTASLLETRGFFYQTSRSLRRWSRFEKNAGRVVTGTHPLLTRVHSLGLAPPSELLREACSQPALVGRVSAKSDAVFGSMSILTRAFVSVLRRALCRVAAAIGCLMIGSHEPGSSLKN
jgi:hypothetical protein